MTPDVVVDIGNTRIKWGRCQGGKVTEFGAMAPDDETAWAHQADLWQLPLKANWVVAGVHPSRRDLHLVWIRQRGDDATALLQASQLPLQVLLEHPDRAGIDRLLDAVAVNTRRRPGAPAIVIDAGSAITVDWLDETGAFGGGAILPGPRLMAQALHDYTALLPVIEPARQAPPYPGKATVPAMEAGVFWAVAGGVRALCEEHSKRVDLKPDIFLTGGDGAMLLDILGPDVQFWPTMTLEGIRIAAEALP